MKLLEYSNEELLWWDILPQYRMLIIGLIWEKMMSDLIGIFKYILIVQIILRTLNQWKEV